MKKRVLFAGPSLPDAVLDTNKLVEIRGPAGCGDIFKAAIDGFSVITLVDGVFESEPTVWHKEILYALSIGCAVLGGASLGALRAAECQNFGMIGVGKIYQDYVNGRRISDADVALMHAPAEMRYLPLTLPLVDIEYSLEKMVEKGLMRANQRIDLIRAAKSIHYKERDWQTIVRNIRGTRTHRQALVNKLQANFFSQKTRDARLLYRVTAEFNASPKINFQLNSTEFFEAMKLRVREKSNA